MIDPVAHLFFILGVLVLVIGYGVIGWRTRY